MPPLLSRTLFALLLSTVVCAGSFTPVLAAWPRDPYDGNVRLSNGGGTQVYPRLTADGSGGAFIAWHDLRNGNYDIFIQRVSATGALLWTSSAIAACTAANDQANTALVPDGAGGVIVAWHDFRNGNWDIFAQRFNAAGTPQWTANGVAICTASAEQSNPQIVTDGAGGAIITWQDVRNGNFDIFARRINAAGAPQWTANGVAICTAAGIQYGPLIASDGAGGAIMSWYDERFAGSDIYAQRVNGSGATQWTANGVVVSAAAAVLSQISMISDNAGGAIVGWTDFDNVYASRLSPAAGTPLWGIGGRPVAGATIGQSSPALATDGASGAIIAWLDNRGVTVDIYAQHMSGSGIPLWQNGFVINEFSGDQNSPTIVTDGVGGAIVCWHDPRYQEDIFAQRISADGSRQWNIDGVPVSAALGDQLFSNSVADGNGGAILTWHDSREATMHVYAQRIERYGELGNPEPMITSVHDTPNDQGGQVKVSWSASYLDGPPSFDVAYYRYWRSVPQSLFAATAFARRRATANPDEAAARGDLLVLPDAANAYAWEYVGFSDAAGLSNYSTVIATTGDSVGGSNPRTAFMVEARQFTFTEAAHWFSAPDSGYSVDNLPPGAPGSFTGNYSDGSADLHWATSHEADFSVYRLYRGLVPGFVPGAGNLVATLTGASYIDSPGEPYFYKLSAVDIHGNESAFAFLQPAGTTDVTEAAIAHVLRLATPQPNPARLESRIEFELPREAFVSLAVYDASGRIVRSLGRGVRSAGRAEVRWNLCDDSGVRVASGLYFIRMETGGRTMSRRLIAMR